MIVIKLLDGETVITGQYTHADAVKLIDIGRPLNLGGIPDDYAADQDAMLPKRTIYPQAIASIEEVPA